MNLKDLNIDRSWTLFLDRDGVINRRIVGDYVKKPSQFVFLPGVLEAISKFSEIFGTIVVVTNQQGIGKGLMTETQLHDIHRFMISEIEKNNGRIDKIYFCPILASENSPNRKPLPGMAFQAKKNFENIDFEKSIMAGDSISDMEFGKNAGMKTVFIFGDNKTDDKYSEFIDVMHMDLMDFSVKL